MDHVLKMFKIRMKPKKEEHKLKWKWESHIHP